MMEVESRSGLSDSSSPPFPLPAPRLWTPAYKACLGEGMGPAQLEGEEGRHGGPLNDIGGEGPGTCAWSLSHRHSWTVL